MEFNGENGIVILYRAMGAEEFYLLMQTRRFALIPNGIGVKYFGINYEETLAFANKIVSIDIVAVIEVGILRDVLERIGDFTHVDPFLFKKGTVEIQREHLEEFNDAIQFINHRY